MQNVANDADRDAGQCFRSDFMNGVLAPGWRSRSFDSAEVRSAQDDRPFVGITGSCDRVEMGQNCPQIEQSLGWVFVHAVAGIQHGEAGLGFQQPRRAGGIMPQDDCFGAQGSQR